MTPLKEWLIRKAKRHYIGPCDTESVKKLIRESEISGYDEIARSGNDWFYIKDCPPFSLLIEELVPHLSDEKTVNLEGEITKVTGPGVRIVPPVREGAPSKPVIELVKEMPYHSPRKSFWMNWQWGVAAIACVGIGVGIYEWKIRSGSIGSSGTATEMSSSSEPSVVSDRPLEELSQAFQKFNVLFFQAKMEEQASEFDKAKDLYQKALELNPPESHAIKIRIRLLAMDLEKGENLDRLQTDFLKLLTFREIPKDQVVEIKNYLGLIEIKNGNFLKAIPHFQEAIREDAHFSPGFYNLGYAYFFQKQFYEARTYFEKAVQLQPNLPLIYIFLGRTLQKLNKNDRAIVEFENANRINPNLYMPYLFLSFIHFKLNQRKMAYGYLEKMINRDPEYDANSYKDARYMQEDIGYDFIIKAYSFVIKEKGVTPSVIAGLGLLYFLEGQRNEGKLLVQKAIDLAPEDAISHTLMGYMLKTENNFEKALSELQTALRFQYQNSLTHILIADILIKLGRHTEAIEHCRRVIGFDPYSVRAYFNMGFAFIQLERVPEALEAFNKVLEYDPNYIPAKRMLLQYSK